MTVNGVVNGGHTEAFLQGGYWCAHIGAQPKVTYRY